MPKKRRELNGEDKEGSWTSPDCVCDRANLDTLDWGESSRKRWLMISKRHLAVQRGIYFIESIAKPSKNFNLLAGELLWCFYTISSTSACAAISSLAGTLGTKLARRWLRKKMPVPTRDAIALSDYVSTLDGAERLIGSRDQKRYRSILNAARRLSPKDFFGFDPSEEPPPSDIPEQCSNCDYISSRSAEACVGCGFALTRRSSYAIWREAMVITYTGESYGVRLGGSYSSVINWLASMRPYPSPSGESNSDGIDEVFYAITHLIYTLNEYGRYRLPASRFLPETEYLQSSMRRAIRVADIEMLAECVDSLRSLGVKTKGRATASAIEYLLTCQNKDGSWGDSSNNDIYYQFHTTWTAIDALRDNRFQGRLVFPRTAFLGRPIVDRG